MLEESMDVTQKQFGTLEVSDQCYTYYAQHNVSILVLIHAMRTCYDVVMLTTPN